MGDDVVTPVFAAYLGAVLGVEGILLPEAPFAYEGAPGTGVFITGEILLCIIGVEGWKPEPAGCEADTEEG